MTPRAQWLIGAAIFVVGVALYFLTNNFWLQTGAMIVFLGGMGIAVSARRKRSRDGAAADARTAGPIFSQLSFASKPVFWNSLGALLVGVGLAGLGTRAIPIELSIAAVIVGAFCWLAPMQGRSLRMPPAVGWLFMPVIAVLLLAFFYFVNPH